MNTLTKISTLMTTELVQIMSSTPLKEAKKLLEDHSIHHLPVVDPVGNLVGILSQSDFLKTLDHDASATTAGELMTTHLAKLEPGDDVRTAANVFALNRFHALPVVKGTKLVGILTTLDLIRFMDQEKVKLGDYK
ncbi:CBS domain-containing protein [Neolewinella persica]|uniref:CBS domain-containing protein n=1 Tax=Neolewinella persica TaxID=70998 RepID=UPI000370E399|nr:CBS domain-containing protein [Neolewinella persica]